MNNPVRLLLRCVKNLLGIVLTCDQQGVPLVELLCEQTEKRKVINVRCKREQKEQW